MNEPLVSIGMPVRNGERFIRQAIDSFRRQELESFELVISDNASDDATEAICREYVQADPRIRYYRADANQGAAWNYNRVFELSRGKYFKWATHDDECLPGFLARCVECLERESKDVVLVYPKAVFIDPDGRVLSHDTDDLNIRYFQAPRRLAKLLARVNMVNAIFGVHRSAVLQQTRLIDRFIGSDYVLMAEIALLGQIWEIPETLFRRRQQWGSCMEANRTNQDIRRWFDPKLKENGGLFDRWFPRSSMHAKFVSEWSKSVRRLPLSPGSKALCCPIVPAVWYTRLLRNWAGLQKRRLKQVLGVSASQ